MKREVSKRNPCPICGGTDWCMFFDEGRAVACQRVSVGCARRRDGSEVMTKGGGWVHRLEEEPRNEPVVRRRAPRVDDRPRYAEMRQAAVRFYRVAQAGEPELAAQALAAELGVEWHALVNLGIGWCEDRRAWTFPMKDAAGRVIGIRTRHESGEKRSVLHSKAGLFYPPAALWNDLQTPWLIVEGPTDAAAALSYGYMAVGRPSCVGQEDMVATLVTGADVVVIADDEPAKMRQNDGTVYRPGLEGARRLCDALAGNAASVRLMTPAGYKDIREMRRRGVSPALLELMLQSAPVWRGQEAA